MQDDRDRETPVTVLFVCTGNTCRSPMAEGLFNSAAREAGLRAAALSCGLSAVPGDPAAPEAIRAALAYGADIAGHRAVPVGEAPVADASRIYGMTRGHVTALRALFPDHAARIDTLDGGDIIDPIGGGREAYELAVRQIAAAVACLVAQMAQT